MESILLPEANAFLSRVDGPWAPGLPRVPALTLRGGPFLLGPVPVALRDQSS